MDEIWERAVETALEGQTDVASVRSLTLDGVVKCVHGRLPPPLIFEKFPNLQHLSIANVGVSSLEQFPRLQNLQKLILSDNRIASGLEFLVQAGLASLRDLDLSNNRIQDIDDLRPLAELKLVSLDLYECPITRVKDYRSRVFGLIRSLKYLDKMDSEENERPESDDEEEDEEDEVDDEDDPGSGEINGEDRPESDEEDEYEEDDDDQGSGEVNAEGQPQRMSNGHRAGSGGIIDADEDEESDADEETDTSRAVNDVHHSESRLHHSNGFGEAPLGREEEEDGEDEEENDSFEEIDDDGDEEDVVEVHDIEDSEDDDVVEYDDDDDIEEDDDEDDEVDNDEGDLGEPESMGRLASTEGEIDGHEQGEEVGCEDDNGEMGEEEQGVQGGVNFDEEEADDEEEDYGTGYLVQPVEQAEVDACNEDPGNEEVGMEEVDDEDDQDGEVQEFAPTQHKRKRDEGDGADHVEGDDNVVGRSKSSKHR